MEKSAAYGSSALTRGTRAAHAPLETHKAVASRKRSTIGQSRSMDALSESWSTTQDWEGQLRNGSSSICGTSHQQVPSRQDAARSKTLHTASTLTSSVSSLAEFFLLSSTQEEDEARAEENNSLVQSPFDSGIQTIDTLQTWYSLSPPNMPFSQNLGLATQRTPASPQ